MLTHATKRAKLRAAALPCLLGQTGAPAFEIVLALGDGEAPSMAEATVIGRSGIPYQMVRRSWEHVTDKQNAAVAAATGEWFTFWDDDDWSAPGRLAATAAAIKDGLGIVGPNSTHYHELCTPTRYTAKFTTGAHVLDKVAAIRRALWVKQPFRLISRPYGGPDPGNVGDWIVKTIHGGADYQVINDPGYVTMMHKTNTATPKKFRIEAQTKRVLDGPKEYTLLGGREAAVAITGDADLKRFEDAVK
jgi:hypothetical protein